MGNKDNLNNEKKYNYKIVFSYDGSEYYGYAKQPNKLTVQGELEKNLSLILGEEVLLNASGRTDKGVHALNQVANFYLKEEITSIGRVLSSINKMVLKSLYIKSIEKVDPFFHARINAKSKTYEYLFNNKEYNPLLRNYELYIKNIDTEKIKEIKEVFIGTHSFMNFTSKKEDESNFIRTIYDIKLVKRRNGFKLVFIGNGFMRYQIRKIVGTILAYCENKITKEEIIRYLNKLNRDIIPYQIDAKGLYLKMVKY